MRQIWLEDTEQLLEPHKEIIHLNEKEEEMKDWTPCNEIAMDE